MRILKRVLILAFLFLSLFVGIFSLSTDRTLASAPGNSGIIFLPMVVNPQTTLSSNLTPELTSLTPPAVDPAKAPVNLTLTGKNFTSETKVRWNGADHPATVLNENQLSLPLYAVDLNPDEAVTIAVYNPGPGGGESNPLNLSLLPTSGNPVSTLQEFITSVTDGDANLLRGVYVEGVMAAPVVQQPDSSPNYVSSKDGTLTQYNAASMFGVTGLLAHNYLGGELFFELTTGQEVILVFGDGETKSYRISAQARYQALAPDDPYSDFIDLKDGKQLTATELFSIHYMGDNHITFQTCIEQEGQSSWGRLFVTAIPVE